MNPAVSYKPDITAVSGDGFVADDLGVVHRVLGGDVQAFAILVRRYNQRLFRLARSIVGDDQEAMDVLQESYVRAFTGLGSFNGPVGFPTWLYVIVRNEAFSQLRKRHREVPTEAGTMESIIEGVADSDDAAPDRALQTARLAGLLEAAIDRLPPPFRVVFVLRAIEGMSVRETAEILELNERTVKTRLFRAKRLLRQRLERKLNEAGDQVYEFAGVRCDRLTAAVMARVSGGTKGELQ
jgi:RNA polymerase sigma-70 factor, ECF subfamily